jgi:hypothetical protein
MQQTKSNPTFSEDRESIGDYSSLSPLSIFAFILGLGSIVALTHPASWVVPLIAIAFGIFALRSIARTDGLQGAVLAWIGIMLALFFLSWASATFYTDRWVVYHESEQVSRRWLNLVVSGEDEIAHQAMVHPAKRQSAGFSVDEYYAKDEIARNAKDEIFATSPISDIFNVGGDAEITLVRNVVQGVPIPSSNSQLVRQIYRITPSGKPAVEVLITLTREYRKDLQRPTWIVAGCDNPDDILVAL